MLVTLWDAGDYIAGLQKRQPALPEWQDAIQALILVVEQNGPTMFARIGVMRALNVASSACLVETARIRIGQGVS